MNGTEIVEEYLKSSEEVQRKFDLMIQEINELEIGFDIDYCMENGIDCYADIIDCMMDDQKRKLLDILEPFE